jgi:hypothetical protein
MENGKEDMIMKCERYACFYKVENRVLLYCAMLTSGEPDYEWVEVNDLPNEDEDHLTKINDFFKTNFTPELIDKRP